MKCESRRFINKRSSPAEGCLGSRCGDRMRRNIGVGVLGESRFRMTSNPAPVFQGPECRT
eukprot:520405-Hanusia_phi.AAC.2